MKREPRPYHVTTLHEIKLAISQGYRRIMVQLPTGAGKTYLAGMIVEGALKKGNQACFTVPAIVLIDQTIQAFSDEGIDAIGVMQSKHQLTDRNQPIQICSLQTLVRYHPNPEWKVAIIDEAHADFEYIKKWMNNPECQNTIFIGLSATPWTKGLGKQYQKLIVGETIKGLIEKGYLSDFRVFATAHPDLTGVKTVAGDYHETQLSEVMAEGNLVASIVDMWKKNANNLPTICFCVDRVHAAKVHAEFISAGIPSGYVDGYTGENERRILADRFQRGEIKVVCNVGVLTKGVDWDVRCVILARPTKSEMLYVQMIGRGLRKAPGKDSCVILDHADNTVRLGFVTDIHYEELDMGLKLKGEKQKKEQPKPKECPKCQYLKLPKVHVCPNCGFKPMKQSDVQEVEGELVEVKERKQKYTMEEKQIWFSSFIFIGNAKKYNPKWAVAQYREKFKVWPNKLHNNPMQPTQEVLNYVKSRMIANAKRRAKERERVSERTEQEEGVRHGIA